MEFCNSDDGNARTEVDSGGSITKTLANAGHSLEGAEAELVLNPLRLAFETKNPKVIELALDCIHVCHSLFKSCSFNHIILQICFPDSFVLNYLFHHAKILCLLNMWYVQKLIAYDHLEGDPGLENGKNVPLFTDVLNMVCGCVDNNSPDRYIL